MIFFVQLLYLIAPLDNPDTSAIPDHVSEDLHPNESAEQSATTNENKSSWRSTASATAKLVLRGVTESADAFGPLKSVTGGLCFILDNCEVRPSTSPVRNTYRCVSSERRQINK